MRTTPRGESSRQFRRSLAPASVCVAGVLVLAACGNGDSADGSGETLTVWHYFTEDHQVELMDAYAERFEAARDGVTVENDFVPYDQMNSNLISAAGSQSGPDIAVFNAPEAGTLALGGALAPMDDYWADFDEAGEFPDSVIHEVDDSIYAVQGYVNLLGLWYNADILDEVGVDPPTTVEELEDAMEAAADAGYDGITMTGLPQGEGEWQAYPWLSDAGFSYDDPDAEALASGFERVQSWVDNGWLSQEVVTWDQTVPFQQFAAGDVAFAENGNWQMGAAEADADFEYGVVPLPLGDTGQVYLGGEGQGIGAFSENPDLAWEYLAETYFDRDGQVLPVEIVGSIPSRTDAAEDEAVTGEPLLEPFAESIPQYGANYPDAVVPPEAVGDVQLTVGQAWSAVLGGQQSADEAAEEVMEALEELLE